MLFRLRSFFVRVHVRDGCLLLVRNIETNPITIRSCTRDGIQRDRLGLGEWVGTRCLAWEQLVDDTTTCPLDLAHVAYWIGP